MTMHLEGPWLSTTGKKKGKVKFASAEAKAKSKKLDDDWKELQKKWGVELETKRRNRAMSAPTWTPPPKLYRGSDSPKIPSRGDASGVAARPPDKVYTGNTIVGISTMHKSNAVPVFSQEDAIEISKMRR